MAPQKPFKYSFQRSTTIWVHLPPRFCTQNTQEKSCWGAERRATAQKWVNYFLGIRYRALWGPRKLLPGSLRRLELRSWDAEKLRCWEAEMRRCWDAEIWERPEFNLRSPQTPLEPQYTILMIFIVRICQNRSVGWGCQKLFVARGRNDTDSLSWFAGNKSYAVAMMISAVMKMMALMMMMKCGS